MPKRLLRFTNERPIPDFVGEDYAGLVIFATNPAPIKDNSEKVRGDAERVRLAAEVARNPTAASLDFHGSESP